LTGARAGVAHSAPEITAVRHLARAKRSGHQRSRAKNVPEVVRHLNAKMKLSCEEIVTIRDLLWTFLENPEEFCR
jgi:hypothetical protein